MTRPHVTIVRQLAAPGILAARDLYRTGRPADALRVAALVEIAAAAATLARTVVRLRHLDPAAITPLVTDPTDARAVLGRGRWLPTMTGDVAAPPPTGRRPAASVRRRNARHKLPDNGGGR